jgi:hypothetical protein
MPWWRPAFPGSFREEREVESNHSKELLCDLTLFQELIASDFSLFQQDGAKAAAVGWKEERLPLHDIDSGQQLIDITNMDVNL